MAEERTRVLIVGGGLVGLSLAVALGRAGIDTMVVDREEPGTTLEPPFDGRASAIAAASWRMLDRLGVAGRIADVQPIEQIRVSDGNAPLFLHYDHHDLGDEPLGQMVENRFTRRALLETIADLDNVKLAAPMSVGRLRRGTAGVEASLSDGTMVRAALLAAASAFLILEWSEMTRPPSRAAALARTSVSSSQWAAMGRQVWAKISSSASCSSTNRSPVDDPMKILIPQARVSSRSHAVFCPVAPAKKP